jgi:hypothetical protein
MGERLAFLVLSYLLGYVSLWLYWYSRPYPQAAPLRQRLARAVMWVGAGTVAAMLVVEVIGCFLHPMECGGGCMGGCWYPPFHAGYGLGLWR